MQNYQSPNNYGYGYPTETNNKPSQSSVQFYDPNSKANSNNVYQGPLNLGYSSNINVGNTQNQNFGYANTPLNTGYSMISKNIPNANIPQSSGYSYVQNLGYSNNAQTGGYPQNKNPQNNYQGKLNYGIISTGAKQTLFNNAAIVSKNANKVLDVCQDKDALGMLIIYDDYKEPNQRFNILKDEDSVNIVSVKSGKLLTVGSNCDRNGAPVFQEPVNGLIGQKFRLSNIGGSDYLIHTFCGKVLDCCQQSTSNGARVIQWDCDRKIHQIWTIKSNV